MSADEVRRHSEFSMESFVKHHMTVILQPLMDRMQEIDLQIASLEKHLHQTDEGVASAHAEVKGARKEVADVRGDLKRTDSSVEKLRKDLMQCAQNEDALREGLEMLNSYMQRIHNDLEATVDTVRAMEQGAGETQSELQSLQANMQRTNDALQGGVAKGVDRLAADLHELRANQTKTSKDVEMLRSDVDEKAKVLADTRQMLDKNNSSTACLEKICKDLAAKEEQLSGRLEGWKSQWSKLHPSLEQLRKDIGVLKQTSDHHDAVVHGLQQSYATTYSSFEGLQKSYDKFGSELAKVQQGTIDNQQGLLTTKEELGRCVAFTNQLHMGLQKTDAELSRAGMGIESLSTKHATLSSAVDQANNHVNELTREHRQSINSVQTLHHELGKTNETLYGAKAQLDATNASVHGLKGELGRTNEAVNRLDHGMEICQAGFSGLQRGFAETGAHVAARPLTLPKISPKGMPSPRVGRPFTMWTTQQTHVDESGGPKPDEDVSSTNSGWSSSAGSRRSTRDEEASAGLATRQGSLGIAHAVLS